MKRDLGEGHASRRRGWFCGILAMVAGLTTCNVFDTENVPFAIEKLTVESTVLEQGETTRVNCRVVSISGAALPDSIRFQTEKGFLLAVSDSGSYARETDVHLDSTGHGEICLVNPFTVVEESVWVTASIAGRKDSLPVIFIPGQDGSRLPCSISFLRADRSEIHIRGSGGEEISRVTFRVAGDWGLPVDDGVLVSFSKKGPGGTPSDSLLNASAATENGLAVVAIQSGTVSGTVLIQASIEGTGVTSTAVPVVIQGGLPHKGNHSLTSDARNLPGAGIPGVTCEIRFHCYDAYRNPATKGTAVYFGANTGGITASGQLDEWGIAKATLTTGKTMPADGFALVWVSTRDDSGSLLSDSCRILLSGATTVSLFQEDTTQLPDSLDIANGASTRFLLRVSDAGGRPVSAGTSIRATVTSGVLSGEASAEMEDTVDGNRTWFALEWADDDPATSQKRTSFLKVTVASRNGNVQTGIWAILH